MRHFAFFLFCLSVSSHLWAQGKNYDLKPEEIKFRYQPNDDAGVPCQHKKHREPWDWKVVCEKGYYKKEFLVHLLMRKYRRSGTDSLEILYWLTNRKPNNKRPNDIPHEKTRFQHTVDTSPKFHICTRHIGHVGVRAC